MIFLEKKERNAVFSCTFYAETSPSISQKEGTTSKKVEITSHLKQNTLYSLETKLFPQRKIQTTHASFIKEACVAYKSPMHLLLSRKRRAHNDEGFSVIAQIPQRSNLHLRLQAGGASEKNTNYPNDTNKGK
ncbi:MAG: hypothetical protein IK000_09410 [Bacteroidaceae bacterium]|nr:hypothetical protein [Bacteroidaceae bacterium]